MLPSSIYFTFNSFAISFTFFCVPLYFITDVLEITVNSLTLARFIVISSVIPSLKYSSFFSLLKLSKGKTAIDLSSFEDIDNADPPNFPRIIPKITPSAKIIFLFCK